MMWWEDPNYVKELPLEMRKCEGENGGCVVAMIQAGHTAINVIQMAYFVGYALVFAAGFALGFAAGRSDKSEYELGRQAGLEEASRQSSAKI